jgi:hypothetical protein
VKPDGPPVPVAGSAESATLSATVGAPQAVLMPASPNGSAPLLTQ